MMKSLLRSRIQPIVVSRSIASKRLMSTNGKALLTTAASQLLESLKEEIKHEKSLEPEPLDWLQEFKSKGIWEVKDVAGSKEVTLSRQFNNEKISVIFSTDSLTEVEGEEAFEEEDVDSPIGLSIIVEKAGKEGALEISASAQDGSFYIDNIALFKDAKLAKDDSSEGDWARRGTYGGPVFSGLDENLVETFHEFIKERGFNEELAEFIPSYAVYKEQREYVKWLENMADFVA